MNRTVGILALALVVMAWGGAYACEHGCCAGKKADCAAKHADCAAKHADCAGKTGESARAAGHECGMKAEECAQYMKKDAETHGWLGISLEMNPEGQMSVSKIWPGSPAEKAGFQLEDRIVSMNGVEVSEKNGEKVYELMRGAKIGDKATFAVARGSNSFNLEAVLARMPEELLAESIDQHLKDHHKISQN
jgi:hypothetical protein